MIVNNGIPYRHKTYIAGHYRYEEEFLEFVEWLIVEWLDVEQAADIMREIITEHELDELWRQFEDEKRKGRPLGNSRPQIKSQI